MGTPVDTGTGAFGETRRALLEALEHGEQQLREQAADIIRRAEERARQITGEAEMRAAELENQLAQLQQEIGEARARLASIRVRASGTLRSVEPDAGRSGGYGGPSLMAEPRSQAIAAPPEPRHVPTPITSREPREAAHRVTEDTAPPAPGAPEPTESPRETLRALRSALEGAQNPNRG